MIEEEKLSKPGRWFSMAYAAGFILLLAMPLISLPLFLESERAFEKRSPVVFPALASDYGDFPRAFEEWFEDHFGFRSPMIRFYRQSRFELGLLDSTNDVVRGKDDWLYYSKGGRGNSIQEYTGANAFSESELERLQLYFDSWGEWLAEQGIEFLVLIAPNKVSVYPEFLPNGISRSPYGTRVERFLERMTLSMFPILFPREELLEAKDRETLLYYKLDTHWNAKGAFVACNTLVQELSGSVRLSETDIQFDGHFRSGGDLTRMLGIESDWEDLEYSILLNQGDWAINDGNRNIAGNRVDRFRVDDSTLPKALVFHDSFMEPMKSMLARHFSETNFTANKALSRDLVLEVGPEIVVVEFTERLLYSYLNFSLPQGVSGR